ncbi:MAG: hypothetical protein AAF449_09120, partial [Myxococcota bacterium]
AARGFQSAGAVGAPFGVQIPGAPALSVAAATGQILARLYGQATLVVASLDAYRIPEFIRRDIFATACQALQRLVPSGVYRGVDDALAALILSEPSTQCIGSE